MRSLAFTILAALALSGCFFSQTDDNAFEEAHGDGGGTVSGSSGGETTGTSGSGTSTSTSSTSGSGSGSTGSGATASSTSNGVGSNGTGTSSGSSGSSGGSSSGPRRLYEVQDGGAALIPVALAQSPAGGRIDVSLSVTGNFPGVPMVLAYAFDGGHLGAVFTPPPPPGVSFEVFPRALADDGTHIVVLGEGNPTTNPGWETIEWSANAIWKSPSDGGSGTPPDAGAPLVGACTVTSSCGEAVDLAAQSTGERTVLFAQSATSAGAGFHPNGKQNVGWEPYLCTGGVGLAQQLAFDQAQQVVYALSSGTNATSVSSIMTGTACQFGSPVFSPNPNQPLDTFDISPGGEMYLGGPDAGTNSSMIHLTMPSASWVRSPIAFPVRGSILGVAASDARVAYLYMDGNTFNVARTWPDGGGEAYPLPAGPARVLGVGNVPVTHAGRQVAITRDGAVFFITAPGTLWYWPPP